MLQTAQFVPGSVSSKSSYRQNLDQEKKKEKTNPDANSLNQEWKKNAHTAPTHKILV